MNPAGKKLQEIYDTGAARLAELEHNQKESLRRSAKDEAEAVHQRIGTALSSISQSRQEAEADIEACLEASLAGIRSAVEMEMLAGEKHLKQSKERLGSLSRRVMESLEEFRHSRQQKLSSFLSDSQDQYESAYESAGLALKKKNMESARNLQVQMSFAIKSFEQMMDNYLVETRTEERQMLTTLFKSYLQSTNILEAHSSAQIERICAGDSESSDSLDELNRRCDARLTEKIVQLSERTTEITSAAESRLKDCFEKAVEANRLNCRESTDDLATQIASPLAQVSSELSGLAADLTEALSQEGKSCHAFLITKTSEMASRLDAAIDSFNCQCNQRLKASQLLKEELVLEQTNLIERMKFEMTVIQSSLEDAVANLLKQSLEQLKLVWADAQESVAEAAKSASIKLNEIADQAREQAWTARRNLLEQIEQRKKTALEEIQAVTYKATPQAESLTTSRTRRTGAKPGRSRKKRARNDPQDSR